MNTMICTCTARCGCRVQVRGIQEALAAGECTAAFAAFQLMMVDTRTSCIRPQVRIPCSQLCLLQFSTHMHAAVAAMFCVPLMAQCHWRSLGAGTRAWQAAAGLVEHQDGAVLHTWAGWLLSCPWQLGDDDAQSCRQWCVHDDGHSD